MCRKLETEAEKVLPFYASSLSPEEDDDVAAAMQEAPSEPLAEVKTTTLLENLLTYFGCFILHCAHCLSSQWLESFSYIWKSVLLTEYLVRLYAQSMISKNIAKLCSSFFVTTSLQTNEQFSNFIICYKAKLILLINPLNNIN